MNHAYNTDQASQAYREFLDSENGVIFRSTVGKAILDRFSSVVPEFFGSAKNIRNPDTNTPSDKKNITIRILDAGCGDGWLAGLLSGPSPLEGRLGGVVVNSQKRDAGQVYACDAGEPLIANAKQKYPNVEFTVCDLNKPLPYGQKFFDVVTASMVLHDVADETAALKNIAAVLKPGGRLIASIVNPYYGYPVGEWKRGVIGRLLRKKPRLQLARNYNELARQGRPNFEWRNGLGSHFTPLSRHITAAHEAGLYLTHLEDLQSAEDSNTYSLTYQLHRFPIILLLEFTKPS